MTSANNYEFVVVKKVFTYATCAVCDGTGTKTRVFRKMKFVEDCPACNGEGRTRFVNSFEVPLKEALKELEQEKELPVVVHVEDIKLDKSRVKQQAKV
jgi:DnaJ-class molecular chaperone